MKTRVLFICTGNCCRSQMAEALLRHIDPFRFEALSAGSHPAGFIHPVATAVMEHMNVSMVGQHSKSWDDYFSTAVDVIITLCDEAAKESCPILPGTSPTAHWPLPDPAFHPGTDEQRFQFALSVAERLRQKIEKLVALDFTGAERPAIESALRRIGEM